MPTIKEIEAAAAALCKYAGNCLEDPCGTVAACEYSHAFEDEAKLALEAAERTRPDLKSELKEHCDAAAGIIANLLDVALREAEEEGRHLYVWEREGIEWLRDQWEFDKSTSINMWVADRYVSNTKLDLFGKMSKQIALTEG